MSDENLQDIMEAIYNEEGVNPNVDILVLRSGLPLDTIKPLWERFLDKKAQADPVPQKMVPVKTTEQPKQPSKKKSSSKKSASAVEPVSGASAIIAAIHEPSITALRILCLIAAVVFMARPFFYAVDSFARTNPEWVAIAMAASVALAAFLGPQILIRGFKERFLVLVGAGLLITVGGFWLSISITVDELRHLRNTASYEARKMKAENQYISDETTRLTNAKAVEDLNIKSAQTLVDSYSAQLKLFLVGTPEYWQLKADIKKVTDNQLTPAQKASRDYEAQMGALPKKHILVVDEQYESSVLLKNQVDFALAVVSDVLGPLMLAVFFYMEPRRGAKTWVFNRMFQKKKESQKKNEASTRQKKRVAVK